MYNKFMRSCDIYLIYAHWISDAEAVKDALAPVAFSLDVALAAFVVNDNPHSASADPDHSSREMKLDICEVHSHKRR
jgi:hypothetical protein